MVKHEIANNQETITKPKIYSGCLVFDYWLFEGCA